MATRAIDKNDIIKENALSSIISDFDKLENKLKSIDKELKDVSVSASKIKFEPKNTKEFSDLLKNSSKLEKIYKAQEVNLLNLQKVETERERTRKAKIQADKQEISLQKQKEKAQKKELTSYQKLSRELTVMRNRYKDLAVQKHQGIKLTEEQTKEFNQLRHEISKTDNALKSIDNSVGQNQRSVGKYENALKGLKTQLLGLVGIGAGISLGRFFGNSMIEYENNLASFRTIVSDLTDDEFSAFEKKIEEVAKSTKKSTSQVAKSFENIAGLNADLAKTADGLGKVSESAITLSKASGDDLATSTQNLIGIMNQFSLGAEDADKAINILAAGQAFGASSITNLSESFKNVGAVASSANLSLADSTAYLETLGKFSLFGAEAGTKLRGVILKLQKANLGYKSGQFDLNDALEEYNGRISQLSTSKEKDALASKVFGAENITAGKILSENIELTQKFTKEVKGTSEAQKAAAINSNTLSAQWDNFKNSLVTMTTTSNITGGAIDGLKNTLRFLSENLEDVIYWLFQAGIAWGIFKVAMRIIKWVDTIKGLKGTSDGLKKVDEGAKKSSKSMGGLKTSLLAIGWTALISLAIKYATSLYDVASGAASARDQLARLEKQKKISAGLSNKNIVKVTDEYRSSLALLNDELKEGKITQGDYEKSVKSLRDTRADELKELIRSANSKKEIYKKDLAEFQKANKRFKELINRTRTRSIGEELKKITRIQGKFAEKYGNISFGSKVASFFGVGVSEIEQAVNQLQSNISAINERLKAYYDALKSANEETMDFSDHTEDVSETIDTNLSPSIQKAKKSIEDYTEVVQDLNNELIGDEFVRKQAQLLDEYQDALAKIDDDGIKADEYRFALKKKYNADLEALEQERFEKRQSNLIEEFELEKKASNMKYGLGSTKEKTSEIINYNKLKSVAKTNEEIEKIEKEHQEKMLSFQIERLKNEIENQEKFIENFKKNGLTKTQEFKEAQNDLAEFQKKLAELQSGDFSFKSKSGDKKSFGKTILNSISGVFKAIGEKIDSVYQKAIDSQNKLIENSQKTIDYLKQSAIAGNLSAKESILAEEKAIEDSQRRIAEIQKKQQRAKLITGILSTYSSKVSNGEKNALFSTIAETAVLTSFLKTLPSFDVGADRLGGNGKGVDGKGGFMAINHPDERILTAEQNKRIGFNYTNEEITKIMSSYTRGDFGKSNQTPILIKQENKELVNEWRKSFNEMNQYNISFEELFSTFSMIVEKKKNGNTFTQKKIFK